MRTTGTKDGDGMIMMHIVDDDNNDDNDNDDDNNDNDISNEQY